MLVTRSSDVVTLDLSKLIALGRTLIRSRSDAVILLSSALGLAWAVFQLTGLRLLIALWLLAELCFLGYQRYRYFVLSNGTPDDACMDGDRAKIIMERLFNMETTYSIQEFFSGWFREADVDTIGRGNVLDFTAYGFFASKLEDLPPQAKLAVEHYISACEERFNYKFREGRNDSLQFMGHLWEPLRVVHKPLLMVLTSETFSLVTDATLFCMGFRVKRCQGFRYWVRKARPKKGVETIPEPEPTAAVPLPKLRSLTSDLGLDDRSSLGRRGHSHRPRTPIAGAQADINCWDSVSSMDQLGTGSAHSAACSNAPIFFMHGVGLGLTPYIHFIYQLFTTFRTRDLVMVECRHVSLSLCQRAVSPDVVVEAVVEVMRRNHWSSAAFIGHSYGTFVLSRMAQLHRHLVESMVLIDPVCMFTVWPQLLQNFIYKLPKMGNNGILGLIDGARYLFSRDLVIAEAFCRKFVWHKVMLWPEEMADVTLLIMSGADDLVPSALVQRHLKIVNSPCQVLLHPTCGHGGFLMDHAFGCQVLDNIKQVLDAGAALAAKSA